VGRGQGKNRPMKRKDGEGKKEWGRGREMWEGVEE